MKNVIKLSEQELKTNNKTSWHDQYRDSAWIFVGGLPYDLSEGDVICIFSQYGEIVNINLVRDKKTGKQKGFGFLCYEDQRSTILAVDNLNGIKVRGNCDDSSNLGFSFESKSLVDCSNISLKRLSLNSYKWYFPTLSIVSYLKRRFLENP